MRAGVGAKWMDGSGLIAVQTGVYPIGDRGDAVYSGCHVLAESADGMKFRFNPRSWTLIRSSTEWRIVELEERKERVTMADNLGLYEFYVDCGRMGSLSGLFVCRVEHLETIMGENLYFGEVLGKHSEVYFDLKPEYANMVPASQEDIKTLLRLLSSVTHNTFDIPDCYSISGFSPFDGIREETVEESDKCGIIHHYNPLLVKLGSPVPDWYKE